MTFNVFPVLNNTKLINDAIKNIPPEDTVQLWVNDDFKAESELSRFCIIKRQPYQNLRFPQKLNLMMHNALCNKEEWVGWLHDDITISLEDIQSLKDAIHDVSSCVYKINCVRGSNVESTAPDPEDIFLLYNTSKYWEANGFDTNYYFYWSDIDFHLRQLALGNGQHGVNTPSVTHLLSSSTKNANPFNKKVYAMRHEFDCRYHAFKHPHQ